MLFLQNAVPRDDRDGLAVLAVLAVSATPLKINPPFLGGFLTGQLLGCILGELFGNDIGDTGK